MEGLSVWERVLDVCGGIGPGAVEAEKSAQGRQGWVRQLHMECPKTNLKTYSKGSEALVLAHVVREIR